LDFVFLLAPEVVIDRKNSTKKKINNKIPFDDTFVDTDPTVMYNYHYDSNVPPTKSA
jgi:hypothetical protein